MQVVTPERIAKLPKAQGYHVPWFVANINGELDFRIADSAKFIKAVKLRLCWICGEKLGSNMAFVIGPMCAINRTASDPPAHKECAEYAAMVCPFLANPHFERRKTNFPDNQVQEAPGCMIKRNPGVVLIWVTKKYMLFKEGHGYLFEIGDPVETLWFREGRPATREEVDCSIETGLPLLRQVVEEESPEAVAHLETLINQIGQYLPKTEVEVLNAV